MTSKPPRNRGKTSPRHPLSQSLLFATKVNAQYGNVACSREHIALALGHSNTSGTSDSKVGSMTHFGLLDRAAGGNYKISALALRILMPASEQDKRKAKEESACQPNLYQAIFKQFSGKAIPSMLGNILAHEYGVSANTRDRTARNFKETMESAGLLQNGILSLSEPNFTSNERHSSTENDFSPDQGNHSPPQMHRVEETKSRIGAQGEHQQQTIPLGLDGRMAKIYLPLPTSIQDLERIITWAEFMKGLVDETP